LIEEILPLLDKANEISVALEASNAVTISRVLPLFAELLDLADDQIVELSKPVSHSLDHETARAQALLFAKCMRSSIDDYIAIREVPDSPGIWWLASYLDPRTRGFHWIPDKFRKAVRQKVRACIEAECADIEELLATDKNSSSSSSSSSVPDSNKRKADDEHADAPPSKRGKYEGADQEMASEDTESEFECYHKLPQMSRPPSSGGLSSRTNILHSLFWLGAFFAHLPRLLLPNERFLPPSC